MKIYFTFFIILFSILGVFSQTVSNLEKKQTDTAFSSISSLSPFSITKVYPNPVKDEVTIEIHSDQPGNVQLSLINILGSEVKKWEPWYVDAGDQKTKLDMSSFHSGIYFLKLVKSNQVATQILKKY